MSRPRERRTETATSALASAAAKASTASGRGRLNGISGAGFRGMRLTLARLPPRRRASCRAWPRRVVDAAEQDVLEGHQPAARDGIGERRGDHLVDRVLLLDRHQRAPQRGVRRVQADREVRPHGLARELLERRQDADGRERELARRDAEAVLVHQHPQRRERRVDVEQRLAHPHHHDVPGEGIVGCRLGCVAATGCSSITQATWPRISPTLQVAPVAADAGQAEGALERTADLRRDADRPPLVLGDVDGLDRRPVLEPEQVLARAVEGQRRARPPPARRDRSAWRAQRAAPSDRLLMRETSRTRCR